MNQNKTDLSISDNFHPASIVVTFLLDIIWAFMEGSTTISGVGIVLLPVFSLGIFIICFLVVAFSQIFLSKDSLKPALIKSFILGVIAAIPLPVGWLFLNAMMGYFKANLGLDGETIYLGTLTKDWRNLEFILRRPLRSLGYKFENIDATIDNLYENGLVSDEEKSELHRIRKIRNMAVHNQSPNDLTDVIQRLRTMAYVLDQRFRSY